MKVSVVTAPGETQVVDAPKPTVGPADVLVKIRACGICGTDALFISMGGIPGHDGGMPLGPCPSGGRCPPANQSRPTRWWSSAQAQSGWARRSRSNPLVSATLWSPT